MAQQLALHARRLCGRDRRYVLPLQPDVSGREPCNQCHAIAPGANLTLVGASPFVSGLAPLLLALLKSESYCTDLAVGSVTFLRLTHRPQSAQPAAVR